MALPGDGAFDYVGTIPAGSLPWTLELQVDPRRTVPCPRASLRVDEAGPTPKADIDRGMPFVLRARLELVRSGEAPNGARGSDLFHVDLALVRVLQPGDTLHLSRAPMGGLGMSALRNGQLMYAVGAVTGVPLGQCLSARIPFELMAEVERLFRHRDSSFELPWPFPVEIVVGSETAIITPGRSRTLAGYEVRVWSGFASDEDASFNESVAISRPGLSGSVAANASARLLAYPRQLTGQFERLKPSRPME